MTKTKQSIVDFPFNHDASLKTFFVSKQNTESIKTLNAFLSNNEHEIFLNDEASSGKTYILHALCNDFRRSKGTDAFYISFKDFKKLQPELLDGLANFPLICIDDINFISGQSNWEVALFNLINEVNQKNTKIILSGRANDLILFPDLLSRIKKMNRLELRGVLDEEILTASQTIIQNLELHISERSLKFLILRSKRDINEIYRNLIKLDKASIEKKRIISIDLIKSELNF